MTVFLVEDSAADAALIGIAVRKVGIEGGIRHFETAREVLVALRDPRGEWPDLLLVDLSLPGMSGAELLDEIRADDRLSLLPVVIMTSSENLDDVTRAYRHHANAYIAKPVGLAGFVRVITAIRQFWLDTVTLAPKPSE